MTQVADSYYVKNNHYRIFHDPNIDREDVTLGATKFKQECFTVCLRKSIYQFMHPIKVL